MVSVALVFGGQGTEVYQDDNWGSQNDDWNVNVENKGPNNAHHDLKQGTESLSLSKRFETWSWLVMSWGDVEKKQCGHKTMFYTSVMKQKNKMRRVSKIESCDVGNNNLTDAVDDFVFFVFTEKKRFSFIMKTEIFNYKLCTLKNVVNYFVAKAALSGKQKKQTMLRQRFFSEPHICTRTAQHKTAVR